MQKRFGCPRLLLLAVIITSCNNHYISKQQSVPQMFLGNFTDDYSIRYTITDSLFLQLPNSKYHIIKWNLKAKYLIAKNDPYNISDKNLYTRIDYMQFENMDPFLWGFCYTVYKAPNDKEAERALAADRKNPKKGCNGYPFSRLKRLD